MATVEQRNRISATTELFMGGVAWCVYALNGLINIIGDWVGGIGLLLSLVFMFFAYAMFAFWFMSIGINVFNPKWAMAVGAKFVISLIPIVNVFQFSMGENGIPKPGIRSAVDLIIKTIREEDAKFNAAQIASKRPQPELRTAPFRRYNDNAQIG